MPKPTLVEVRRVGHPERIALQNNAVTETSAFQPNFVSSSGKVMAKWLRSPSHALMVMSFFSPMSKCSSAVNRTLLCNRFKLDCSISSRWLTF